MNERGKNAILVLVALVLLLLIIWGVVVNIDVNNPDSINNQANLDIAYGRFLDYVNMGWVKSVDFYDNGRIALVETSNPELGEKYQKIRVEVPVGDSELIEKLREAKIDINSHPPRLENYFFYIIRSLVLPVVIIASLIFLLNRPSSSGNRNSLSSLREVKSDFQLVPKTNVTFDDVAGVDEAKEEFEEIVTFLKKPFIFTSLGAKIPKGVLLVGPPGTGKTLLVKAIANEARVPFISVGGSEFVEMFVGVGAARVRDLFRRAKENSPCIIFIDEIDSIGRQRGVGIGGGNDEREQTLNQLLTEMDGFNDNTGVMVIGATNRADILDAALLRAGRFDRRLNLSLPDKDGREAILKVHARNKPIEKSVSLDLLALKTPGFSGAGLANLLNEAAILAVRYKKDKITDEEISESLNKILGGLKGDPIPDSKIKRLIAFHEAGHALVGTRLKHHQKVERISIAPRGSSKGKTEFAKSDNTLISRNQILAQITGLFGGRAAELVVFGDEQLTTNAGDDLQRATYLARQMVTVLGMSKIGPVAIDIEEDGSSVFLGRSRTSENELEETISTRIDKEIISIINFCYYQAIKILSEYRILLDLIVEDLIKFEGLEGDELRYTVLKYAKSIKNSIRDNRYDSYGSRFIKIKEKKVLWRNKSIVKASHKLAMRKNTKLSYTSNAIKYPISLNSLSFKGESLEAKKYFD